jgi:hypothetical protein
VLLLEGDLWPSNGQGTYARRQANGLNRIVENCEIWSHHGRPIAPTYGMQVLNNHIHDNGQLGIGEGLGRMTIWFPLACWFREI